MRLAPRQNAITVTLPATCPPAQALAFLHNNKSWLASRLKRVQNAFSFTVDSVIPIEGQPHRIVHSPKQRGGAWIENGQIIVCGETAFISRRVIDCLRHHAARVLGTELREMAKAADLKPTRLDIRDPTSRWGSCSTTGRIMLSWRLIMAPPEVRHYLIAHELSHLVHMNAQQPVLAAGQTPHPAPPASRSLATPPRPKPHACRTAGVAAGLKRC